MIECLLDIEEFKRRIDRNEPVHYQFGEHDTHARTGPGTCVPLPVHLHFDMFAPSVGVNHQTGRWTHTVRFKLHEYVPGDEDGFKKAETAFRAKCAFLINDLHATEGFWA
jgi:hypothetical protein